MSKQNTTVSMIVKQNANVTNPMIQCYFIFNRSVEAADKEGNTAVSISSLRDTRIKIWILLLSCRVTKSWYKDNGINGKRRLENVFHFV